MEENNKQIVIEHYYDAPAERVFNAWITPTELMQWHYADEDWSTPYAESDTRAGRKFKIGFKSPDGKNDFDFEGVYDEVTPPAKLVYTIADGRPVTITFDKQNDKTKLTLNLTLENENSEAQQRDGWSKMLDHLDTYLSKA